MKMTLKTMLFAFIFMTLLSSCNKEELFTEPTAEEITDPTTPEEETPEDNEEEPGNASLPCDFNLNNLQPNQTVIINCAMDLKGATIQVPSGVTLVYEGGEIINGTLNFSSNGIISGELLNKTLDLKGGTPTLKETTFEFVTNKWGIVEGKVSSAVALSNRDILEDLMLMVKDMEGTTFKIDALDAYFEVGNINNLSVFRSNEHAIEIPSNFILKMSNNTHLRVYPNRSENYALMVIYDSENVTIDGGNLYGDRDEHDYSLGGSQEHGHCLQIRSGSNIVVKNAKFSYGSGDGIDINSIGRSFESNYKPSSNITITNNVFDSNRRNNISVTDGRDIIIENNQLLNASVNTSKSRGVAPGFGIDIEAVRHRASSGELIFDQIAKDIIIRNNVERGSRVGAITVHIGYHIIVENNVTEMPISYSYTYGTKIVGNTVKAKSGTTSGTGIIAGVPDGDLTVYDNEVSNNLVQDYPVGITIYNRDAKISNNKINNFTTGIYIKEGTNIDVSNNELTSGKTNSKGLFMSLTYLKNVRFANNIINVTSNPFNFSNINIGVGEENYKITLEGNTFNSSSNTTNLITKSKGIDFTDNKINNIVQVFDSVDLTFTNNNIISTNNHGVYLRNTNINIKLTDNTIDVPTGYECIKLQNTTIISQVSQLNNSCK